ncbi:MAG: hypothetical protein ABI809_09310 [Caldimonas sp.]
MKEYRLASWPELPGQFRHAGHRRILSDMSHRHLTIAQLVECSGLKRHEVVRFVDSLEAGGHVSGRKATPDLALLRWLRQLPVRLRRAVGGAAR